jgi:uncharacterized damage-inducible protein DinB
MHLDEIIAHWQDLRGRTYDVLNLITPEDLPRTLLFPESATLYNQFWCMLGTSESFIRRMAEGSWQGWRCSLGDDATLEQLRTHLKQSDEALYVALRKRDVLHRFDDGSTPLSQYFRLVEHESHHQGQLINFIFALNLPIPESWADAWALSRDEAGSH